MDLTKAYREAALDSNGDTLAFVKRMAEVDKVSVDASGIFSSTPYPSPAYNSTHYVTHLKIQAAILNRYLKPTKIDKALVAECFSVLMRELQVDAIMRERNSVFEPCADLSTASLQLTKFVQLVTGTTDIVVEKVVEQFIWQVKRKLRSSEVQHHVMPILVGAQGAGKSTVVYNLLSPIRSLTTPCHSVKLVEDERKQKMLADYFVIFFDEMGKANESDVESIKRAITDRNVSYRVMHTNDTVTAPHVATFIGASNKSVGEMITDSTGMRRFFQIDFASSIGMKTEDRWQLLNEIDYVNLWRMVDESRVAPILAVKNEVDAHQEELTEKDSFDLWIDERGIAKSPTAVFTEDLHQNYTEFMRSANLKPLGLSKFGKKLKLKGFEQRKKNNKSMYCVGINEVSSFSSALSEKRLEH